MLPDIVHVSSAHPWVDNRRLAGVLAGVLDDTVTA